MNSSTPRTMWAYSLATEPGYASDHTPVSASTTPSTTRDHTAAADVVTTTGESATSTPITSAAQSCQRRHVPTCPVAIATTTFLRPAVESNPNTFALVGEGTDNQRSTP